MKNKRKVEYQDKLSMKMKTHKPEYKDKLDLIKKISKTENKDNKTRQKTQS